jgi:hypothetical protein
MPICVGIVPEIEFEDRSSSVRSVSSPISLGSVPRSDSRGSISIGRLNVPSHTEGKRVHSARSDTKTGGMPPEIGVGRRVCGESLLNVPRRDHHSRPQHSRSAQSLWQMTGERATSSGRSRHDRGRQSEAAGSEALELYTPTQDYPQRQGGLKGGHRYSILPTARQPRSPATH